jgi:hypothetical protein
MSELWDSVDVFLALRLETEIFTNEKGKFVSEIINVKWLWDLVLLCVISHHIITYIQTFRVNRNSFLICLWLLGLFK